MPRNRAAGSVVTRGKDSHLLRVYLGTDPATGKRLYHNETFHGNKTKANERLAELVNLRSAGKLVQSSDMTVNEYLDQWLASAVKPRVRERTYHDYEHKLALYVRKEIGARRLDKLTPLEIQALYTKLQFEKGLSERTVRYVHAILGSALKWAVRMRLRQDNPAEYVELPRKVRHEMRALSPEEVTRFLKAADADGDREADRFALLFHFAIATGMRPGEYLALQWSDVDLKAGTISVQRALAPSKENGGWKFEEPKTARGRRTIPLPETLTRQLAAYKKRQAEEIMAGGEGYTRLNLVFPGETGLPLSATNLTARHLNPVLERAGLRAPKKKRSKGTDPAATAAAPKAKDDKEEISLYTLRHTCATLLLAAGENPKVVSERLGHASVTLTLDTYSHVLPTMQKGAASRLEAMMYGGSEA